MVYANKHCKVLVILIVIFLKFSGVASCQQENPVQWKFISKKLTVNTFEIHCIAVIKQPWHIYTQNSDSEIATPTCISIKSGPNMFLLGKPTEMGSLKTDSSSGFFD